MNGKWVVLFCAWVGHWRLGSNRFPVGRGPFPRWPGTGIFSDEPSLPHLTGSIGHCDFGELATSWLKQRLNRRMLPRQALEAGLCLRKWVPGQRGICFILSGYWLRSYFAGARESWITLQQLPGRMVVVFECEISSSHHPAVLVDFFLEEWWWFFNAKWSPAIT